MSPSKRITRVTALALSATGIVAILAAAALGLSGWPPAKASAAPVARPGVLGVGSQVSGPATQLDPAEKVGVETSHSAAPASATQRAIAPLPKRVVAKKAVARKASSGKHHKARKFAKLPKGWRRARVSWYGPGFYGHTMAGGGNLRRNSMVVAHRSLPFGTRIEFKYKGRSVTAVVKDRGPFVGGREFDLGPGTARALHFGGVGTVSYRILGR